MSFKTIRVSFPEMYVLLQLSFLRFSIAL